MLNVPAAALLLICDGARTVDQVVDAAVELCPELPASKTRREFRSWLDQAVVDGLLLRGRCVSDTLEPLESTELGRLADGFYEAGSFEDACRCYRSLVDTVPDDPDYWRSLGDAAHSAGFLSESCSAYKRYLQANPDDACIAHLVKALDGGLPPPRASNEYVAQTFDSYADTFDDDLLTDLEYKAPELLLDQLRNHLPAAGRQFRILDLGCGTGLAGKALSPWAKHMVGVDLSAQMAGKAVATGVYGEIHIAEVTAWLESTRRTFDLMLAADVLVYFGDLSPVLSAARATLSDSSMLAFTLEASADPGYSLTSTGRYAHHLDYVHAVAKASGYFVVHLSKNVLRTESDQQVIGHVVVLGPANSVAHPE